MLNKCSTVFMLDMLWLLFCLINSLPKIWIYIKNICWLSLFVNYDITKNKWFVTTILPIWCLLFYRVCEIKSVDNSAITAFCVHECESSNRMGSRPRRYLFTGHSNGTLQVMKYYFGCLLNTTVQLNDSGQLLISYLSMSDYNTNDWIIISAYGCVLNIVLCLSKEDVSSW